MTMSATDPFAEDIIQDITDDYLLALSLQAIEDEFNSRSHSTQSHTTGPQSDDDLSAHLFDEDLASNSTAVAPKDIVSPELELSDPNPNIWDLMRAFDRMFFGSVLAKHCIELSWSSRMTSTAGLCGWSPTTNFCYIRLSLPLLQLRSRKDLVETLIHEMIHALLFVTREDDNHESHGQKFHEHMHRINRMSGADITVYHSFHGEVHHYQQHVWRCDGACRSRAPYFGYVRRAMNRPPGPTDYWFPFHAQSCGGKFAKISEPPPKKANNKPIQGVDMTPEKLKNKDIRSYLTPNVWTAGATSDSTASASNDKNPFSGVGHRLGAIKTETKPVAGCGNYYTNESMKVVTSDGKPVLPFSGKGRVLGSGRTGDQMASKSTKPSTVTTKTDSMPLPPKKSKIKENIEVIQID